MGRPPCAPQSSPQLRQFQRAASGLTRLCVPRHIPPFFEGSMALSGNPYRSRNASGAMDTCGSLRADDVGRRVTISGWVNRRRDHGGLLVLDLRDHYGIAQCVVEPDCPAFAETDQLALDAAVLRARTVDEVPVAARAA